MELIPLYRGTLTQALAHAHAREHITGFKKSGRKKTPLDLSLVGDTVITYCS
jgi:hypothetical protein